MTKEEEFEELKAALLQSYAEYYETVRNMKLSCLSDFNKRGRLIETFALSVPTNAAFRSFINKYNKTELLTSKENN